MKSHRPLFAVLFSILFAGTACAQIAVYAGGSGAPVNGAGTSSAYGALVGIYAQKGVFLSIGADARASFLTRSGFHYYTGAAGPRVAFKMPVLPLRPYIEGLVGVANYNSGSNSSSSTNLNYQIVGGLDATILPHIDWRVIEFDYSAVANNPVNAKIFTTGLVIRLW